MAWRWYSTEESTGEAALPPKTWPDLADKYGRLATIRFIRKGFCGMAGGIYDE